MRLLIASLLLAFAPFCLRAEVIDIDNAEATRLMASGVPMIDIRTTGEWEETGIVPNSRLLTYFDENGKADTAAWLGKAKGISRPDDAVILICRSGNRTRAAGRFLTTEAGYTKVYHVRGGIKSWIAEGRPVAPAAQTLAGCRAAKSC